MASKFEFAAAVAFLICPVSAPAPPRSAIPTGGVLLTEFQPLPPSAVLLPNTQPVPAALVAVGSSISTLPSPGQVFCAEPELSFAATSSTLTIFAAPGFAPHPKIMLPVAAPNATDPENVETVVPSRRSSQAVMLFDPSHVIDHSRRCHTLSITDADEDPCATLFTNSRSVPPVSNRIPVPAGPKLDVRMLFDGAAAANRYSLK